MAQLVQGLQQTQTQLVASLRQADCLLLEQVTKQGSRSAAHHGLRLDSSVRWQAHVLLVCVAIKGHPKERVFWHQELRNLVPALVQTFSKRRVMACAGTADR